MSTTETIEASHTNEELDSYISINDSLLAIENEQEVLSREWDKTMIRKPVTLKRAKKLSLATQRLLEIQERSVELDARESELMKANATNGVHVYAQDLIQRGRQIQKFSEDWSIKAFFEFLVFIGPMWAYFVAYYILQVSQTNQYFGIFFPQTIWGELALLVIWITGYFLLSSTIKFAIAQRKNRKLSSTISPQDIVFLTRLDQDLGRTLHECVPEYSAGR